jgi:hypothetical protein
MASADLSQQILFQPRFILSFTRVCEISHGKTINLHSIHPHHLQYCVRVILGFQFVLQPHPHNFCLMVFAFLGPELCRQLPSDSTSRWTPLLLANGWRLQTPITDFHRKVYRHAWRTKSRDRSRPVPTTFRLIH